MVDSFTLHSLVRYTYNESSADEKQQLEELFSSDEELRREVQWLKETKKLLPAVSFYALDRSVDKILEYSRR